MCLADFRIAADDSMMFMGDVDHGLPNTTGLSWLLPRLVGSGRARWLAYLSRPLNGNEALAIGLVEEVHPRSEVLAAALSAAATIASKPGSGISLTRRLIDDGLEQTFEETLQAELDAQRIGWSDPQVRAAMHAFLNRRG
jgi:enoyl-CoA hydratase/carnithine racemase